MSEGGEGCWDAGFGFSPGKFRIWAVCQMFDRFLFLAESGAYPQAGRKLKASAWYLQRFSNGVAVLFFSHGRCRRRLGRGIECAANPVMAGSSMPARFLFPYICVFIGPVLHALRGLFGIGYCHGDNP